ncbi:FKBP-type peptidyl-prolyl cis-trans isomerase [Marinicella sp. S1101]|uniref:FKBP-type peptidyl-prolyl cis-trans isomerase n=1 Tax=Marinicella marina TaxID=2996016 RepID=UPI002260920C|nr:FKBP-type peptidyl-prolyl cis-trans isomerase [Marinicella marina]MCX7554220.1 FKBP-type peptidyl-prolyl cis-trans isomerase [Marinicella marina]MDJ1138787.1 FKBP-type peptidyl-prolyl cis-trans isomerase [Marinicella marina]
MKKLAIAFGVSALLVSATSWADMDTDNGQINYKIGSDVGKYLKDSELDFDKDSFMTGLEDALSGRDLRLTPEELTKIRGIIQQKQQEVQKAKREKMMAELEVQKGENAEKGAAFLKAKATEEGVMSTESGMLYEVLEAGTGPKPASATATVVVHYTGTLIDGTKFDSSVDRGQPATFGLNQVIKGWTEGLQLMNQGAKYRFYIPPELAYGSDARPGSPIGPNSTLIFDVELIEVK